MFSRSTICLVRMFLLMLVIAGVIAKLALSVGWDAIREWHEKQNVGHYDVQLQVKRDRVRSALAQLPPPGSLAPKGSRGAETRPTSAASAAHEEADRPATPWPDPAPNWANTTFVSMDELLSSPRTVDDRVTSPGSPTQPRFWWLGGGTPVAPNAQPSENQRALNTRYLAVVRVLRWTEPTYDFAKRESFKAGFARAEVFMLDIDSGRLVDAFEIEASGSSIVPVSYLSAPERELRDDLRQSLIREATDRLDHRAGSRFGQWGRPCSSAPGLEPTEVPYHSARSLRR